MVRVRVEPRAFGRTAAGATVTRYDVRAGDGSGFAVLDFGGAITEVRVPDRAGRTGNVTLAWPDLSGYERNDAYLGVVIGRCANRIAAAQLPLAGRTHALSRNEGRHHLHGGAGGFHVRPWRARPFEGDGEGGVELRRTSPAGEEGYPGTLEVTARMTWTVTHELRIAFHAVTDAPTAVNPTQHAYWNLADGATGTVLDHRLTLFAGAFTPVDAEGIPTGRIEEVTGTPFDLRAGPTLGEVVGTPDPRVRARGGLDHNFVLRDGSVPPAPELRTAAILRHPPTGRRLTLRTSAPGLQVYTGNDLGEGHARHAGVALEAQGFPDAPHHPSFPSWWLGPDAPFRREIRYAFASDPA